MISFIQYIIQLAIVLFVGKTGPLQITERDQEMTVVTDVKASFGHPVAPGNLLDVFVWVDQNNSSKNSHRLCFDAKVRDFPYYTTATSYGITFKAATQGECELKRVKKRIYGNIGC